MTEKEILNNIFFALTNKKNFFKKSVGAEINTKESLTSQEHYTVQDLIKSFIREKPELLATAREIDDDDAPDFPSVDAHDDIVDIEEKMEVAENIPYEPVKSPVVEAVEPKKETAVVSESSSTSEK